MEYRSLQHAVALAEEGSFVRAAERVALTQSAMSRSILALEQELGVALFDRTPAGVRPTAAGQMLIERARRILADTQALQHDIAHARTEIRGAIAFGSVPSLAVTCVPRLLVYGVDQLPRLRIKTRIETLRPLCQMLRNEEIEFIVAVEDAIRPDPDLELRQIGTIRGGRVFCRPGHPLAQRQKISNADLLLFPFASGGIEGNLESMHRAMLDIDANTPLNMQLECDNLFVLQRVIANTDALLIASQSAMSELVAAGALVELPIQPGANAQQLGAVIIVTLKGRTLSPAAAHLIGKFPEFLRSEAPES
jgi:DNA-binding transcriptional LysR family regulator